MLDTFACPVCGNSDWSPVETFVYARTDRLGGRTLPFTLLWRKVQTAARPLVLARPRRKPVHYRSLSDYQFLRRGVLFDVWFPSEDTVTLTSVCCTACSFMAYSPRPSEPEVSAKYAYLKRVEPDVGGQTGLSSRGLQSDDMRAARVFERCRPHVGSAGTLKVLDYGGGNGKLLRPFVDEGHSCFIVDYNDNPIPSVTKICDDMGSFPGDDTFDLIICSHVLEHVSDLGGLVSFLRRRLDPGGLLYAEVPQEIWAGLKLEADPVTHIDFFTAGSLSRLFFENGFDIINSERQVATYGKTGLEVLWVLAQPATQGAENEAGSAKSGGGASPRRPHHASKADLPPAVKSLLYPSRRATLRRMYEVSLRPRFANLRPET
jgi:SAM-dependent methyltransferase